MVKTTILLDDDLYRRLVKEAVEQYGTTKKLSKLINEKLRQAPRATDHTKKRLTVKLGRVITERKLEEEIESAWVDMIRWTA